MSCFGGLSQVLSNIGHILRLHCGTIVCAPGVSGQDSAGVSGQDSAEQLTLPGSASVQELGDEAAAAVAAKGDYATVVGICRHVPLQVPILISVFSAELPSTAAL